MKIKINKSFRTTATLITILCLICLVACGGGGGGSSDSDTSSGQVSGIRCSQNRTAAKFIHAGIDSGPVNIIINGSLNSSRRYSKDYVYFSTSNGQQISYLETVSNKTILADTFSSANTACKTYLFTGSHEKDNLHVTVINDQALTLENGNSAIRFLNATSINSEYSFKILEQEFIAADGEVTTYQSVPSGAYNIIAVDNSGNSIGSLNINLQDQQHQSLILRGDPDFILEMELHSDALG
jgi:hypothetical protein